MRIARRDREYRHRVPRPIWPLLAYLVILAALRYSDPLAGYREETFHYPAPRLPGVELLEPFTQDQLPNRRP